MSKIQRLIDILDVHKEEFVDFFENPRAIFLYGSFAYQDLESSVRSFEKLNGKGGLLDRKPDFIVIVSDLEQTIKKIAKANNWNQNNLERVLRLSPDSPFYFNLNTHDKYDVAVNGTLETLKLPYKIGVIGEDAFSKMHEMKNYNIYLPARLSKFFNIVHQDEDIKPLIEKQVDTARNYFIELALQTLPQIFTGEKFTRRYLFVTYLSEIYRIFDIMKSKHLNILEANVYDTENKQITPMRTLLMKMLSPKLSERDDVEIDYFNENFYDTIFINKNKSNLFRTLYHVMRFNISSARISFRNSVTNTVGGASNLGYVWRKFRPA